MEEFSRLAKKKLVHVLALGIHVFLGKLLQPPALDYTQTFWLCIYDEIRD